MKYNISTSRHIPFFLTVSARKFSRCEIFWKCKRGGTDGKSRLFSHSVERWAMLQQCHGLLLSSDLSQLCSI